MRRGLSIFLILFFTLAPVASAFQASDESRLPPCCRRHGAHHCAMYLRWAALRAQSESGKPVLSAPSTCPCYPRSLAVPSTANLALPARIASLPSLRKQAHSATADPAAACLNPILPRFSRGPPPLKLA